jgi:antitoxin (DNA-binding transcriptional repressor) of toxin-antitoxin stability system
MAVHTVDLDHAGIKGEAVAKIVPLARNKARRRFGSARGQLTVPDDFDAPLDDNFGSDLS